MINERLVKEFVDHLDLLFSDSIEEQKTAISHIKEALLKHPSFVENDVIKRLVARYMLSDEAHVRLLIENLFNSLISKHEADGDKNEIGKKIAACVEERGAHNDFMIGMDQEYRLKSIRAVVNGTGAYLAINGGFGFLSPLRRAMRSERKLPSFQDVRKAICSRNYIGEGNNARVYKVGSQQEYVIKVNRNTFGEPPVPINGKEPVIVDIPALRGRNVGQAIALYGPYACLQLHQKGEVCNLPLDLLNSLLGKKTRKRIRKTEQHHADQTQADFLYETKRQQIASISLDGYTALFKEIRYLNENGMHVDCSNGGNLLFDAKANQFKIVDIMYGASGNVPVELLFLMINCAYFERFYQSKKRFETCYQNRIIVDKTLLACEEASLPLTRRGVHYDAVCLNRSLNAAGIMSSTRDRKEVDKRIAALSAHSLPKTVPFPL